MQAAQYMCVCVCVRCTRIQQGVVVDRWFKLPHHYIWHLSSSFGGIHGYAWLVAGTLPRLGKLAAEETGLGRGNYDVCMRSTYKAARPEKDQRALDLGDDVTDGHFRKLAPESRIPTKSLEKLPKTPLLPLHVTNLNPARLSLPCLVSLHTLTCLSNSAERKV